MKNGRHDNSIDALPDELRRAVRDMLASKKPRFSYDKIIEHVAAVSKGEHRLSMAALSRYWNNVLSVELIEADRRADWSEQLASSIAKSMGAEGGSREMEDKLLAVIDGAFFANEIGPDAVNPADLLSLRNSIEFRRLKERELDLKAQRLSVDEKRLLLQIERLERENERLSKDEERRRLEAERILSEAPASEDEKIVDAFNAMKKVLGIR